MTSAARGAIAKGRADEPLALDFTYDAYSRLLVTLVERGYAFTAFTDGERRLAACERFALLRHDIDFDPSAAVALARIEAAHGVRATYFFLVGSEHYNVVSPPVRQAIGALLDMGHNLGLHFDPATYGELDAHACAGACRREARLLEEWFDTTIDVVSFHRPQEALIGEPGRLTAPLIHTYMPLFVRRMTYLADSRGRWRFGHPLESAAFRRGAPLHLLVHPIWWSQDGHGPPEALARYRTRQAERLARSLARHCSVHRHTHCGTADSASDAKA